MGFFAEAALAAEADFLAYGDLRGFFEPCGCDPETDLGGVLRINAQLRRERMVDKNVTVLDLGNNLSERSEDLIKNKYILRSELKNKPTAYLLNRLELAHLDQLKGMRLPYVLSNGSVGYGQKTILTTSSVILGYTWVEPAHKGLERVDTKLIERWKTEIKKSKKKESILMFSGPSKDLETIAKAQIFTSIVSSNTKPIGEDPGKEESQDETLLVRLKSPAIFMVPAGGQGILRSGKLTTHVPKSLDQYLKNDKGPNNGLQKECSNVFGQTPQTCNSPLGGILGSSPVRVTWLDKKSQEGTELLSLYQSYSKDIAQAFKQRSQGRLAALKHSPFAGSEACTTCHENQHKKYMTTKHAHAMQTLLDKGKSEDQECVNCHSLGAQVEGGFVSLKDSPQFANVQCENCHGPRRAHVENPSIQPSGLKKGEAICVGCHNRQHSPSFSFAKYWKEIEH